MSYNELIRSQEEKTMNEHQEAIKVLDLDHLGIVAGIIDELELVEEVNKIVGITTQEIVSPGQVMKAMILNGLGFLSAPLYLFEQFFEGKATSHLIGKGILPEHLNDDRLGRALDKYYQRPLAKIIRTGSSAHPTRKNNSCRMGRRARPIN